MEVIKTQVAPGLAAGLNRGPRILNGLGPGPGGGRVAWQRPRTLVVSWQAVLDWRTQLFHLGPHTQCSLATQELSPMSSQKIPSTQPWPAPCF